MTVDGFDKVFSAASTKDTLSVPKLAVNLIRLRQNKRQVHTLCGLRVGHEPRWSEGYHSSPAPPSTTVTSPRA